MYSRELRTVGHGLILVSVMLGLIAAALWFRPGPLELRAEAKGASGLGKAGVDPAGERIQMVQQLEALNQRMDGIDRGLRDGSYSIQALDPAGGAKRPAAKDQAKDRP